MVTTPQFLPPDINVELLLSYYSEGDCRVALKGLHKRNTYGDIIDVEDKSGFMDVTVGRLSLYNSLPEFMFHPTDRFDNLPKYEEKERFQKEIDKQDEEIENAFTFFAPIDVLLLKLRSDIRQKIEHYTSENVIIEEVIGDSLTDAQKNNQFIRHAISFLPHCKDIRGNRTLLTFILRKIFMEEDLILSPRLKENVFTDATPHYADSEGMELGDGYLGNTYTDSIVTYDIHYWSDNIAGKNFMQFIDDVEGLRCFIRDFFLAVGEDITFDITNDEPPLRLSDDVFYNYLNYNTNI